MSPPRSKYLEQNGPVNLAIGTSSSPNPTASSPSISISPKDERSPMDVGNGGQPSPREAFSPNRLPYPNSPAALTGAASMYQHALNYGLYSRGFPMYPPHPLAAARSLQRPFLTGQLDPYPTFIPSVPFTPPGQPGLTAPQLPPLQTSSGILPPPQPSTSIPSPNGLKMVSHHGMDSRLPPNVPSSPHPQLPPSMQMQMHKMDLKSKMGKASPNQHQVNYNNNHHQSHNLNSQIANNNGNSSNSNNQNSNNTDNVGFKVPSGKEGSLKHRILRPYEKDAKQRSPTSSNNGGSISYARCVIIDRVITQ